MRRLLVVWGVALLGLGACDSDSGGDVAAGAPDAGAPDATGDGGHAGAPGDDTVAPVRDPASVAEELGLTKYVGQLVVSDTHEVEGAIASTFDPDSGPMCMRGAPFRASTRAGSAQDLVVFLQGGGLCWTEICLAVTGAPEGVPGVDILRPDVEANPVADWNVAYAPYCDGSIFSGDADVDEDGDGEPDRFHRGLANLTATLEVAKAAFPTPPRVLLAGSSGGAYGTFLGAVLTRHFYPDAEIVVMADSGTGMARGEGDPDYIVRLLAEQGSAAFVPPDCPDCLADGHVTALLDWWFRIDANVRVGMFSSWYDSIIGDMFLQIPPAEFRDELARATDAVQAAWPDRARRFIIDGRAHTTLLGDPSGIVGDDLGAVELPPGALAQLTSIEIAGLHETAIGELAFTAWLRGLIDGDLDVWVDIQEAPGPVPGDDAEGRE